MDHPGNSNSFKNNHGINDTPTINPDDFLTEFSPATGDVIDTLLDFIFNEDSNSSTSSDSTISEEPRGEPSTSRIDVPKENGIQQADDENGILLKLNKKIKKVEKEVEALRKSISGLCK